MSYSQQDIDRFKSYERIHLRGINQDLPVEERVNTLKKKDRNKWFMIFFNAIAIFFFSYSYYFGITQLSDTIFLVLVIVFSLNVALIYFQKKQIKELIRYYRSQT